MAGVVGRAELTSALCFFGAFLTYAGCCKTGIGIHSVHYACVCNLYKLPFMIFSIWYQQEVFSIYINILERRGLKTFSIRLYLVPLCVNNYTMQGRIYCYTEYSISVSHSPSQTVAYLCYGFCSLCYWGVWQCSLKSKD